MTFTQQRFLGASIRSFSGSVGWGNTPSRVSVRLVEDASNNDTFVVPAMGQPVLFNYSGWTFGGIITNWEATGGESGNPLYDVVIEDAREVLNGTQVILDSYNGQTYGIPNLLNVYGYLENGLGFGGSQQSQAGIQWELVRDAIIALTRGANPTYGDSIAVAGYNYELDLSNLPALDSNYRITSKAMTLMDFCQEVCSAAVHDFFFTVEYALAVSPGQLLTELDDSVVGIIRYLKIHTINRNIAPTFGAITNFIASTPGAVSKKAGFEFSSTETSSKFLVGGKKTDLYYQNRTPIDSYIDDDDNVVITSDPDEYALTATVWPFWGTYANGDVVLGTGFGDHHKFVIDSKHVPTWPYDFYPTTVAEMRAAESQDTWETFLNLYNFNYFIPVKDGRFTDCFRDPDDEYTPRDLLSQHIYDDTTEKKGVHQKYRPTRASALIPTPSTKDSNKAGTRLRFYRHNGEVNIHFGKASILNPVGKGGQYTVMLLANQIPTNAQMDQMVKQLTARGQGEKNNASSSQIAENANILTMHYNYVKEFADEYYGRKFMVRIPFVSAAQDPITTEIRLSREVTNGGYVDTGTIVQAASQNLLPLNITRILTEDNRIEAFAKFDNGQELDLSEIPDESMAYNVFEEKPQKKTSKKGASKTSSQSGKTFKDFKNYKFSAFVKADVDPNIYFLDQSLLYSPRVVITLPGAARQRGGQSGKNFGGVIIDFLSNVPGSKIDQFAQIGDGVGSDLIKTEVAGEAVLPWSVGVPLQSNIDTYGPWYAVGANGKMDYEEDNTLVPWNYGGYTAMEQTANAKVLSALSLYQISEAGEVQYPGVPSIRMGSQLALSGPYVTDINVNIGEGGATTTYRMKTWTPQPYRLSKQQASIAQQFAVSNARLERELSEKLSKDITSKLNKNNVNRIRKNLDKPAEKKTKSSHDMVTGQAYPVGSGYGAKVVFQPNVLADAQTGNNVSQKGAASLDTLFYPWGGDDLPQLTPSASGAESPTQEDLNPYVKNNLIGGVLTPSGIKSNIEPSSILSPQGIGFTIPAMGVGWGYTTEGEPTHPAASGDGFAEDVAYNSIDWKVGPIDYRWDNERGVWSAGGGAGASEIVKVIEETTFPTPSGDLSITPFRKVYYAQVYEPTFTEEEGASVTLTATTKYRYVGNFRNNVLQKDNYYVARKTTNGAWIVDNQAGFQEYN